MRSTRAGESVLSRQSDNPFDRIARNSVFAHLRNITEGKLTVCDPLGEMVFGDTSANADVSSRLSINDLRFYRLAALRGGLGIAEAYIQGLWTSDDIAATFRMFVRRIGKEAVIERAIAWLFSTPINLEYRFRRNTREGSRRNISEHYDLGNDLFQLFLDETMTYSAGIFETPQSSLREASVAKLDRICQKLRLKPEHHIVEIGSGWGSFAIHAASNYCCKVTTTTISKEQFELAQQRVNEAGLADKITILLTDYRDLKGQYDRLVSIEMIEAVGHNFLGYFFAQCDALLKPNGAMLVQAITMPDQSYGRYLRSVDFIRYFVFPGSNCPSRTALLNAATGSSTLRLNQMEEIGPHYATTLNRWRENFMSQLESVRALGYSDEFIRLWEFYLAYCEVGFSERHVGDVQMLFAKSGYREEPLLPPLRVPNS